MNSDSKLSEIGSRINQIRLNLCGGKNDEFAAKIGKSWQYASAICNGRKQVGKGMLEEILKAFPQVSRTWLYFGEGEMLNAGQVNQQSYVTVEGDNIINGSSKETIKGMDTLIATNARLASTLQQQADQIDRLLKIIESKL
jgi:plasmid maintenance system antidote protein VapI